jgi:hypothetical protein
MKCFRFMIELVGAVLNSKILKCFTTELDRIDSQKTTTSSEQQDRCFTTIHGCAYQSHLGLPLIYGEIVTPSLSTPPTQHSP